MGHDYIVYGQTDIGLKRNSNQDNYLIQQDLNLFAVADGMGGHQEGDLASKMALQVIEKAFKKKQPQNLSEVPKKLIHSIEKANQCIFNKSFLDKRELGMGTTLVLAYFFENHLFIANIGDSRLYLMQRGFLWQITEDHSLLNEQMKLGLIKEKDIKHFKYKNIIVRCLGIEKEVQCDIYKREIKSGDRFLLCSDGLSNMLSDKEMLEVLSIKEIKKALAQCINFAKKNGGDDNITGILIDFG